MNSPIVVANELDLRYLEIATHSTLEISGFFAEYRFLSNFWPVEIIYDSRFYQSVENAYQAAKFLPRYRGIFELCEPGDAKRLAKYAVRSPDWKKQKIPVMRELLYKKFSVHHPELRDNFIATQGATLTETNWWGDTFWGKYTTSKNVTAIGENHLGELLMEVRASL